MLLASALFTATVLGACSSESDADIVRITINVGVDSGTDRVEEIPRGATVEVSLTNAEADDKYHVHGYDLGGDVTPKGGTKVFTFNADIAGDFEIESHATEMVLVILRVS